MSEYLEPFEQRLKRQPPRRVPAEWRREILAAANDARMIRSAATASRSSSLSELSRRFASVLWPHPVAWGGLAMVWILIFVANISIHDKPAAMAEKVLPPSPEVIAESPQQQRLFAQLIGFQPTGSDDSSDPDRQKPSGPRPRSERIKFVTTAIL